ncbi:MAG: hypothetical protein JO013_03250 [Alphaproteobacteria bacterium]|nr:hypothetical protein [Alphaproteobacteria bacterium]
MNRDQETLRTDLAPASRAWTKPAVARLRAGAAEVGTRNIAADGPLSSKS